MPLLWHLLLGFGLGVATSMPLGVANAATVDAAVHHGRGRALGIAAGGASADVVHAGLAFAGLGPLLSAHPEWAAGFFLLSGVAIAGYGVRVWCATPVAVGEAGAPRVIGAFTVGLLLTVTNPGALMAWMFIAAAIAPESALHGGLIAGGIGLGAFTWFAVLVELVTRGRDVQLRSGRTLSRVIGGLLIAVGVFSLLRGLHLLVW